MKTKSLFLFSTIAVFLAYILLRQLGFIGLWTQGIAFIANDTEQFTDGTGHPVTGSYSVSIDLSDLESNIGKVLYDDGAHKIYVSFLESRERRAGGYLIGFRASGRYSRSGASLVSGVRHATVNGSSFTSDMTAALTAEYKGNMYASSIAGIDGLNYKDGDAFYFYLFPSEAYEQNITTNETGVVRIYVSNLYKNIWSKN